VHDPSPTTSPRSTSKRLALALLLAVGTASAGCPNDGAPPGFARGSGRLEAEQIHIATKLGGRVSEVLVDEGDPVSAGELLARMDDHRLQAELEQARAELAKARQHTEAARAVVAQRESECDLARKELGRTLALHDRHVVSESRVDQDRTRLRTARAACDAAEAEVRDAEAAVDAARAAVDRVREDLEETELRAPLSGRVQYRLAEPGEVLPAGGRILTLLDLDDVTMALFLPTAEAGRTRVDAPARIVLDAHPDRPLEAHVSFVASEAQFTPKEVETQSERQKLSFRVEVRVDDARGVPLNSGTPGVGWIRLDPEAAWPEALQ
jgi:HlyD family secretion protein